MGWKINELDEEISIEDSGADFMSQISWDIFADCAGFCLIVIRKKVMKSGIITFNINKARLNCR